ncbi:hypothetical protein CVT25_009322 [Psilocybe cyanescens]|uniref:IgA peptidase M64-domain-containing protein n=1 Tax=Psilocybe cyanescens TaxID=93625 RepID=A0A409VNC1_PSICY|nr:hypothetical protein CVT25_009322 [Psilocybe cyanescens]
MMLSLVAAFAVFLHVLGVYAHVNNLMGWESASDKPSVKQLGNHAIDLNMESRRAGNLLVQGSQNGFHGIEYDSSTDAHEISSEATPPPLEIIPLIISGPSTNRVDLVFFSDGYLPQERQKFIDDALRLAVDVSKNQTFNTVQPLLNFWAAFSPSNETGIGNEGPKDLGSRVVICEKRTPFGLYRVGTELRGVYYAYPNVGRAACDSLGEQCDYPILLGNDPLYGGLGGDFTVITASILNGPLVLRHELGHSILEVGEEYDGGYAYFGSNAGHDTKDFPWKQWLSRVDQLGGPRIERSVMAMQAYPWTLLNTTTPWSVSFNSSGTYERYSVQLSLAGIPNKGDLLVTLDGVDLGWEPRTAVGMDRWFYNYFSSATLSPGIHELKFSLLNGENLGSAQLCSTEILEYGSEDEFVTEPGFYSLYPTYSDVNETSYRPTNGDCLMRAVTTPNFCKVCLETLWLNLLRNVTFIDDINESCSQRSDSPSILVKTLRLGLLPLAHLRNSDIIPNESYTIFWKKNGKALPQYTNKTVIEIEEDSVGEYTATVKFSTEEIRINSPRLESELTYQVVEPCKDSR